MLTNDWRVGFYLGMEFHPTKVQLTKIITFPSGSQALLRLSPEFNDKYQLHGKCLKIHKDCQHPSIHPKHYCTCTTASSSSGRTQQERKSAIMNFKERQRSLQRKGNSKGRARCNTPPQGT